MAAASSIMICHEFKCIFIHIPRTAGSSIEHMIAGKDWWEENSSTKHITASQAKRLYAAYWKKYFKFSFVRHPVDRVVSCLKYANHFGLKLDEYGHIDFAGYRRKFGPAVILEFDHRYYQRENVQKWRHKRGAIYGNILDEKLDFIGKYENLEQDIAFIKERIGITGSLSHYEKSSRPSCKLTDATIAEIRSIYHRDFRAYGYQ